MAQPKGKPSNNKKKEEWYPIISKSDMKRLLRKQGIFEFFDIYNIGKAHLAFFEEDICEFINRACRAVYLKSK